MSNAQQTEPKVVYLDQCAVGELFAEKPRASWVEILRLLKCGIEAGKIVAPMSPEHILETAGIPDTQVAEKTLRLLLDLSGGEIFVSAEKAAAIQLLSLVSGRSVKQRDVIERIDERWTAIPMAVLRDIKSKADAHHRGRFAAYNASVEPSSQIDADIIATIELMSEKHSREQFDKMIKEVDNPSPVGPPPVSIPIIIVKEFRGLSPSPAELAGLRRLLHVASCCDIPTLHVSRELSTYRHLRQMRCRDSDYYDVTRLQVAVPYADLVVTDGKQLTALSERGLSQRYCTKVFTCSPLDDEAIAGEIRAMLS